MPVCSLHIAATFDNDSIQSQITPQCWHQAVCLLSLLCVCAVPIWLSLSVRVCRLHTIIDCDMVLVMDNGSAAEWGRPSTLLEDPNGTFSSTRLL